jgi:glycosyltransferase involved in cell wall biosynthesis
MTIQVSPLVSVIVPTYNRAKTIKRSIDSVLQQTYTNFELIIVDDGSTDDTEGIVRNINDQRIQYIKCTKNGGANKARNIGIKASQGTFIAFQDSDDDWYPDKLEKQVEIMQKVLPSVGVVYSGYFRIMNDSSTYIPPDTIGQLEGDVSSELLKHNFVGTPTMLIRKECFEKVGLFDEQLPRFQDWELSIRLSKHYHFKYMNEATINAYVQTDSITSNNQAQITAFRMIFEKHYKDFSKDKKLFIEKHELIGKLLYLNGNTKEGRYYLWKAYKLDPLNLKLLLKNILLSLLSVTIYKKILKMYQFIFIKDN